MDDLLCPDNLFFAQDLDGVKAQVMSASNCGKTRITWERCEQRPDATRFSDGDKGLT